MDKVELIRELAGMAGMKQGQVENLLRELAGLVRKRLRSDGEVKLPGLGKLAVVARAAREGRNPQTGAPMTIPAGKKITFKPGKELKETL